MSKTFLKNYAFSFSLLVFIVCGSILGIYLKDKAVLLKPLGDIFLNLLFTAVVPLVFFSISSAIAGMGDARRLGRIFSWMLLIFIGTGIFASIIMIVAVRWYPPAAGLNVVLPAAPDLEQLRLSDQLVKAFTVTDFADLLSKRNMLALIVFSLLMGLATLSSGEKGRPFAKFLLAGNSVMIRVIDYIMWYAPIGLGAYFAYLIGVFGPHLLGSYARAMMVYYPVAILYFFAAFSLYAYWAGRVRGVRRFWAHIFPPALTALTTGSSVATIPVNLEAANKIGTPKDISEVVIPIGATIHMEGSCLSAVLKIAVLFGLFQMDFSGTGVMLMTIGVALLSGTVMSGIPGGGFLGELMIVTLFGFPIEALPIISLIGTLVDPPATMVNAAGDNVSSMMVARILGGKQWMEDTV